MSEEFVCLYNFIEDDHAIETFFDNLSLRVKVVILDNVDPESDFYTKTIKSRWVKMPSTVLIFLNSDILEVSVIQNFVTGT